MPTVNFNLDYLNKLANKNLSQQEIGDFVRDYGLEAKVGSSELELEVTAERPDLLAPEGFIRVMNSYKFGKEVEILDNPSPKISIRVDPNVSEVRPYIGAVVLRNVNLHEGCLEEFFKFQEKVSDTFGRNRRKAAIGAYDFSSIEGNISYSLQEKSKLSFIPLGETKKMTIQEMMESTQRGMQYSAIFGEKKFVPVLTDQTGKILSVPPIINAEETKLTKDTRDILVDVTGISKDSVENLLSIVSSNFLETGSKIESVRINYSDREIITPEMSPKILPLGLDKVAEILGKNYSFSEAKRLLNKMGLRIQENGSVLIPRYRTDLLDDSDFSGEILLADGLDNLLKDKEFIRRGIGKSNKIKDLEVRLADISSRIGFQGVANLILTNPEDLSLFSSDYVSTSNPKNSAYSVCRTNTQISLIETLASNLDKIRPLNIYEIGDVIQSKADDFPYETKMFGFASLGSKSSFSFAKSCVQTILSQLNINYHLENCEMGRYIPGRAATILLGKESIGHFGEIHPKILNKYSIPDPISSGELDLKKIR